MTKSIVKVACGVLILLMVIGGASACAPKTTDQITEAALQAMSNGDFETFLEYFTPADRSLLTEAEFDENCRVLQEIIGDYIDNEYWKTEEAEEGYTIVYYKAHFSDEPADVTVVFYFEEVAYSPERLLQRGHWRNIQYEETYIAGLWFDSPKIQEYLGE